jgi:hypothetical protein
MKTTVSLLLALLAVGRLAAADAPAPAHDHAAESKPAAQPSTALPSWKDGSLAKPDPAWFAQAVAVYPLTTCVVTGDKLESVALAPTDFVVKQAGQPDRLVRFCCNDCQKDFVKEPAKYLKIIDAAAAKAKAAPAAKQ